ncbi:MAG: 16S rRNA (guanine(966)-N(2))-methyltransferase RsmD [Pseudomonadota bacterium]
MRIIGGEFSGRRITAPPGRNARPTTDRNREALFNILAHDQDVTLDGARVIDLFAGSGALGLEALSRGAAFCLFIDTDAKARGAIRDNIEALGLFGRSRLHRRSATNLGAKPAGVGAPFTLAFLDPPYRMGLAEPALETLRDGAWLQPGAAVIVEQAADEPAAEISGFVETDRRRQGDTQISRYVFDRSDDSASS